MARTKNNGLFTSTVIKQSKKYVAVVRFREDGHPRRITKTLSAKTKTQARRILREVEYEMYAQAKKTKELYLFDEIDTYIDRLAQSKSVEYCTLDGYRRIKRQLAKYTPNIKLKQLTPNKAQDIINKMAKDYAPVTVKKAKTFLCSVAENLVYNLELEQNPFKKVKTPKKQQIQPNALDKQQRQKLKSYLDESYPSISTIASAIALYTGLRRSEVCALCWQDVNIAQETLYVRHALTQSENGYITKAPKTNLTRCVPIAKPLKLKLIEWKLAQVELFAQAEMPPPKYVCAKMDGTPYNPDHISREWRSIATVLSLIGTSGKLATFHDLRHTFATAAIAGGIDVKTVSSILGHKNADMTLNIYASADPEAKRQAGIRLSDII